MREASEKRRASRSVEGFICMHRQRLASAAVNLSPETDDTLLSGVPHPRHGRGVYRNAEVEGYT